jgi:hypothetical protein
MEDAMSGHAKSHRSSWQLLLPAVALMLVAGLLSAGPVAAHTFTRNDGNDSPGKLDLRSVSVSHTSTGVVHKIRTYGKWTARSLGRDSFFIFQIDKDNRDEPIRDRYERCAFIFFAGGRLRGSLTNCGSQFIRYLPVAKVSGTVAKITIPKSQTGKVYWWAVASLWDGPAPCGNGCIDFAPNNFPDVLHDLARPSVVIDAFSTISTDFSASTTIPIGFTATDTGGSGIRNWKVQSSPLGSLPWTTRAEGTGGGSQIGNVVLQEGSSYFIRALAWDKHGNMDTSATRMLRVPFDDSNGMMVYSDSWVVDNTDAEYFLSSHHVGDAGDSVTFTVTGEGISIVSGPGTGTVSMTVDGADGPTLYMSEVRPKRGVAIHHDWNDFLTREITLTVDADSTFILDGIAVT